MLACFFIGITPLQSSIANSESETIWNSNSLALSWNLSQNSVQKIKSRATSTLKLIKSIRDFQTIVRLPSPPKWQLKQKRILKIWLNQAEPFVSINGDKISGFSFELSKAIATILGSQNIEFYVWW